MRGLPICNLVPIKRRVPIYSRPIKFKRSHAGGNCEVNEITSTITAILSVMFSLNCLKVLDNKVHAEEFYSEWQGGN